MDNGLTPGSGGHHSSRLRTGAFDDQLGWPGVRWVLSPETVPSTLQLRLRITGEEQVMRCLRVFAAAVLMLFSMAISASATEGLFPKPSANPVDATLDRLEAALKERGFVIF